MVDYKKNTILLGMSDIASLILVGCCGKEGVKSYVLKFGGDGVYHAYLCDADQEVPSYYEKVWECDSWLKIYDDKMLMQTIRNQYPTKNIFGGKIEVYRAGDYGCLIKVCKKR